MRPAESGAQIDGYILLQPLGSGGMGEVWLARDSRLGRRVALKLLPPDWTRDQARIARFEHEARAASSLNHPHVCTILALGETADGLHYIAMEYVEGETLRARLTRARPTIRESLDIAAQVASALSAAHAAGIVHRDLKPENVMVRPDGAVKVLDFGLAKLVGAGVLSPTGDDARTLMQTGAGIVVGTVTYMAPEQARGQDVDGRADIWALGVVLYELVAGRRPFAEPSSSDLLVAILERDPAPLVRVEPGAPPELQRIVAKALKKDREQRYQTVKDMLLDLQALGEDIDLQARRHREGDAGTQSLSTGASHLATGVSTSAGQAPRLSSRARRRRLTAGLVVVAILAAIGAAGWWARRAVATRHVNADPSRLVPRRLVRLTFAPGLQTDVTWSPNGRSVAYTADTAGNFDIWVQSVEGGEPVQLTRSPAADVQPAWSPDGRTIVFRSDRDGGGLFIVPASGGPDRRLTTFGARPKWAPDGSQVLFANTDLFIAVPDLYTVRLDGAPPRPVLRSFLRGLQRVMSWNWHPDSRRVSLLATSAQQGLGIYTVPLSGGPAEVVKYTPELGAWANAFEWAPSGATFFAEGDSRWMRNIVRFSVDPRTLMIAAGDRLTAGDGWETNAAVSVDGKRLAFTMSKMSLRLWTFPFDAAAARVTGPGEPVTDADAKVLESDLSRDGSKLAYRLTRPGGERDEFWTTDLARGESRRVASDDQIRSEPHWSADGSAMVYQWTRSKDVSTAEQALAIRRMGTGDEQVIMTPAAIARGTANGLVIPYDWSPDGRCILASSLILKPPYRSLGLWPLAAAPHAETAAKVLASDKDYSLYQARFSPDGRWIAFQGVSLVEPGASTIFVMPAAGDERSGWTALTGDHDWADKLRWSPDGNLIYFVLRKNSFFNLWAVRFDSARGKAIGEPFQVTRFDSPRRQISPEYGPAEIGVSAKRLVLTIMEQTSSVWMLDGVDR